LPGYGYAISRGWFEEIGLLPYAIISYNQA
jgi:hypothetical protein